MTFRKLTGCFAVVAAAVLSACAPANYAVTAPTPSKLKYVVEGPPAATSFSLVDERRSDARVFSSGVLPAELLLDGKPIEPVPFLASQVQAELGSRGLPVTVSDKSTAPPMIHLKEYRMQNMRTSGYSPFITLTYLAADVDTKEGPRRIAAFVTRGKVPVMSFKEIIEPTLNQPLSLGVQEFSSKIANVAFGYRASDETVKELVARINGTRTPDTFLDVYKLGFTNHPAATDTLVALVHDGQEYVRQAAIASLGNMGATTQFGLLKSIYQDPKVSWQDHCVALKAIADLGTPEARAFITDEAKRVGSDSAKESQVLGRILALYL